MKQQKEQAQQEPNKGESLFERLGLASRPHESVVYLYESWKRTREQETLAKLAYRIAEFVQEDTKNHLSTAMLCDILSFKPGKQEFFYMLVKTFMQWFSAVDENVQAIMIYTVDREWDNMKQLQRFYTQQASETPTNKTSH